MGRDQRGGGVSAGLGRVGNAVPAHFSSSEHWKVVLRAKEAHRLSRRVNILIRSRD